MAKRPSLPLEAEAAIERAKEHILRHALVTWDLLFGMAAIEVPALPGLGRVRKPANLKLQLREYSVALFDAEAQHYAKHASSDYELRLWLQDLALCIEDDVTQEMQKNSAIHNFHCSPSERKKAIVDGLAKRIDHWTKTAEKPSDASPVAIENAGRTLAVPTKPPSAAERRKAREDFVLPILRTKGMTPSKWATRAGVDPSVIYDYLKGQSTPRPDSRNVMAEAIGIKECDLPE